MQKGSVPSVKLLRRPRVSGSPQSITGRCRPGQAARTSQSLRIICLPRESTLSIHSRSLHRESTRRAKHAPHLPPLHSTFCPAHSRRASSGVRSSRHLPSIRHSPRTVPAATTVTTRPMATRFPTPFLPAVTLLKSRLTPSPPRPTYLDMSSPFPRTCKRTGAGKTQPRSHRLADLVKGRPSVSELRSSPATTRHHRRQRACSTHHRSL